MIVDLITVLTTSSWFNSFPDPSYALPPFNSWSMIYNRPMLSRR